MQIRNLTQQQIQVIQEVNKAIKKSIPKGIPFDAWLTFSNEDLSKLKSYETFRKLRKNEYYIGNYGTFISVKGGKAHIIKPCSSNKDSYQRVSYYSQSAKQTSTYIHHLVAKYFCFNPWHDQNVEVHHVNGCPWDNRAVNLIYIPKKLHPLIEGITDIVVYGSNKRILKQGLINVSEYVCVSPEKLLKLIREHDNKPQAHRRQRINVNGQIVGVKWRKCSKTA